MQKIKENKIIFLFALVVVIFFGMFVKMNYSVDTYLLLASKNLNYIQEFLKSGRVFTALFFKVLSLIGCKANIMYLLSFIIAIVCAVFSIHLLYKTLNKYNDKKYINAFLSIVVIINPFVIELWLFAEMGIMMLSVLASILAYKNFDDYLESNKIKNLIISIIFMLIALFSYQGTVAIFISLTTVSIFIHSKNIKQVIKNIVLSFVCYGVPTLLNFAVIKLIGNNRVGGQYNFLKTADFILTITKKQLLNGFGLYPASLFKIIHLIALAIALIYIFTLKGSYKDKLKNIAKLAYLIIATWFFTIATIIPQDVTSAAVFPRTSYAFASLFGIIFVFVFACANREQPINNKIKTILNIVISVLISLMLIMEFIQFIFIAKNRYYTNDMDKNIVTQIDEQMSEYELKSGNKIENIAMYNIDNTHKFSPDVKDNINVRATSEQMSGTAIIVFYTHRILTRVEPDHEVYDKHFKNRNWENFDIEQIVFDGNTMHWYLY